MAHRRATRLGATLLAALLLIIAVLAFRGWTASSRPADGPKAASEADAPEPTTTTAPAAAARRPAGISGHVRDADGNPQPQATVCASAAACLAAKDDGTYAFDELPTDTMLAVVASAAGHVPSAPARIRLGLGERRDGVDLVVRGGGAATRGRVKDALGGVVAGASIAVSFRADNGEKSAIAVATDARGEFVAWVGSGPVSITATSPGYAVATAYGVAPGRYFELSLVPGSALVGRAVERSNGASVAGAKIEIIPLDGPGQRSATSADDGSFRIEGLAPGRYRLEGLAPGLSGYSRAPVLIGVAETSPEVVVELEASPAVSGRVLEARTQAPCREGTVTLRDRRSDEYASTTIEPDGAAHFVAVLPGTYEVDVRCADHASRKTYPTVVVADRALDGLSWEVDRGNQASGVVVDADGAPVANAHVSAEPEVYDAASPRSASTDARGVFVLRGLAATKYAIVASAESRTNAKTEIDVGNRDHDGLRLALGRGARIKGRVTDLGGAPIAGVTVHVSGPSTDSVETGADGTFEATGLDAGEYRLGVRSNDAPRRSRRQGYGRRNGKSDEDKWVRVAAGETTVSTLVLERRAEVLEGVVVDARGAPLSDHFVEAQRIGRAGGGEGSASASRYDAIASGAITDSLGRFRIERLGAGDYHVRAFRPGGAEGIVARVSAGAKDVSIKVVSGSISGTVRAPRGVRPDRFHVSVSGPTHRSESIFHANGAFVLREVPPGDYDVTVSSAEGTATEKVTVVEDRTATVTLSLEEVAATE